MTRFALVFVLICIGAMLTLEYKRLTIKPWPPKAFENDEMHFKYGSIGAEVDGYPYLIWRELPTIFKDKLPGGFGEFGFLTEHGQELPIGVSVRRYGVNRVGFNCATCHTTSVDISGKNYVVYGAPANQLDLQRYIGFLSEVSADPRLTPDAVFKSAEENGRPIGYFNRLVFKHLVFPRLSDEIASLKTSLAWLQNRPEHGPGRTDAGNFWRARWGLDPEKDTKVGTVDFPAVWNQRDRLKGWFHWDGNNRSLDERNISAALAGGASEWLLERQSINRVSNWLLDLPAPKFPAQIDLQLAEQGRTVYEASGCGDCHEIGSVKMGQVVALDLIKTDPQRSDLFSDQMVDYFGKVGELYSWHFKNYRSTDGYVNMPLDGIWLRAPYLHNGSVPTLEALLLPGPVRPKKFYRGCTNFNTQTVGFECSDGFLFDTGQIGNSALGHDYGVDLPLPDRTALIEYLKTL